MSAAPSALQLCERSRSEPPAELGHRGRPARALLGPELHAELVQEGSGRADQAARALELAVCERELGEGLEAGPDQRPVPELHRGLEALGEQRAGVVVAPVA